MAAAVPKAVPVFPLPGVVLFPHARLDLRVFELRYRTLVRDALAGDRTIAIATLEPGWEHDYHGSPAFHPLGCRARCDVVEWLPDDCYRLQVCGLERVRFGRVAREFPYRACEFEPLRQAPFDADDPLAAMECEALRGKLREVMPLANVVFVEPPVLPEGAGLEVVVNALAHALRVPAEARLELLAEDSVFERARRLQELLRQMLASPLPEAPPEAGRN